MPRPFTSYKYEALDGSGDDNGVSRTFQSRRPPDSLSCTQVVADDGQEYEMQTSGVSTALQLHEMDGIHDGLVCPTEEERQKLRRVADNIPWNAYCAPSHRLAFRGLTVLNFV